MNLVPAKPEMAITQRFDQMRVPHYLTREQVYRLIEACAKERDRLLVRIGWETGGRISELLGICGYDLDLAHRQVRLRTLKRRGFRKRKRVEQHRWVPISESLTADLALFQREHPLGEQERLFRFTRQRAFAILRAAGERAGLIARGGRRISPHILRHSFAMNLLSQGVPINVLKELLGHASVMNTMVYLKVDPAEARNFLAKVER